MPTCLQNHLNFCLCINNIFCCILFSELHPDLNNFSLKTILSLVKNFDSSKLHCVRSPCRLTVLPRERFLVQFVHHFSPLKVDHLRFHILSCTQIGIYTPLGPLIEPEISHHNVFSKHIFSLFPNLWSTFSYFLKLPQLSAHFLILSKLLKTTYER